MTCTSTVVRQAAAELAVAHHPRPCALIKVAAPERSRRIVLSGIDTVGLLQSVDVAVEMNKAGDHGIPVPDYVEENVSTKVVKIIQSYVGIVNKMVWRKG